MQKKRDSTSLGGRVRETLSPVDQHSRKVIHGRQREGQGQDESILSMRSHPETHVFPTGSPTPRSSWIHSSFKKVCVCLRSHACVHTQDNLRHCPTFCVCVLKLHLFGVCVCARVQTCATVLPVDNFLEQGFNSLPWVLVARAFTC